MFDQNNPANDAQHRAITHPPGPLMILAGAGTGKTATLIHRISNLVNTNQAIPENILLLTFTEKATTELKNKLEPLLGDEAEKVRVSTFHALCLKLIRQYSQSDTESLIHWEDADKIYFLLSHIDQMDFLSSSTFRSNPSANMKLITNFISRAQDELYTPEKLLELSDSLDFEPDQIKKEFPTLSDDINTDDIKAQWSDLIGIYKFYQDGKKEFNAIDYGDMIMELWGLISKNNNVLDELQERFKFIFIDEYQDNNISLNRIMNRIAGKRAWITVVGDEDQCIYSFRGANYYNIQDFRNRYKADLRYGEIKLVENYRSTNQILDLANRSISLNEYREPKNLVTPTLYPKSGDKPVWIHANNSDAVSVIATKITEHVNSGGLYKDCAIICRSVKQVTNIASGLQEAGIPADFHVENFFSVPIIRDLMAWLEVILNGNHSETGMARLIIKVSNENILTDISKSYKRDEIDLSSLEWSIPENITPMFTESLKSLKISINELRSKIEQKISPEELVWAILKEMKHFPDMESLRDSYRYLDRLNIINLGEFLSLAEKFTNSRTNSSLRDWLFYINTYKNHQNPDAVQPLNFSNGMSVQVMTIHKSKGLQFPIVFIPFLRSQSFPGNFRSSKIIDQLPITYLKWANDSQLNPKDEYIQEERRIFYVACTRAMEKLYLIGPAKATSIFLKELINDKEPVMVEDQTSGQNIEKIHEDFSLTRQKLITELNRSISSHQYDYAEESLQKLKSLDLGEEKFDSTEGISSNRELHLSASKIEAYNKCGLQYRLKYIDKVPEGKSQPVMEFGSVIHAVLEKFHQPDFEKSLENLIDLYEENWREDIFEYKARANEFKSQGNDMLTKYYDFFTKNSPEVIETEKPFTFTLNELKVTISGKIDRIDKDSDGKISVIDYKTGNKGSTKAKKSLQLALYIEAIKQGNIPGISGEPGSASLYWLRQDDDPIDSHVFSVEELNDQLKLVAEAAEGIRRGRFEPKVDDFHCRNCDYKDFLCKAWEEQ